MTDSEAMKKAMQQAVESRTKVREADAVARKAKAKQKPGWIEKLKMGATGYIKEKYHSPAGREHLKKKKTGKGRGY
jgi:hypothetical protein